MSGLHALPLVGPGSELQLTIDGRAVPHADVVAGAPTTGRRQESRGPDDDAGRDVRPAHPAGGPPAGQTRLTGV